MVSEALPTVAVLGASGLIGHAVATALEQGGFPVVSVARRFTQAQAAALAGPLVSRDLVAADVDGLAALLAGNAVDVVVNCVGILQDGAGGDTHEVHTAFVGRLLDAMAAASRPALFVHVSIPGVSDDDHTAFSRTKRAAEARIRESRAPHVILRPGFVVAPAAYGGSAMIRALAALPLGLPRDLAARPFAAVDVADIARTVSVVARQWQAGERDRSAVWDLMAPGEMTVGGVVAAFRRRFGGPPALLRPPGWMLRLGAVAGDWAARLGWAPPMRSTALAEMARGVTGDPGPWMAATGIAPSTLDATLRRLPATVQETWFARLYLLKAVIVVALAVFWIVSGLIALSVSFGAATEILTARGYPAGFAVPFIALTSSMDIAVGVLIAFRRTHRAGLMAGIVVSLGYLGGTALLTPDLWLEPLGALVKTVPAIVLMVVGLAVADSR